MTDLTNELDAAIRDLSDADLATLRRVWVAIRNDHAEAGEAKVAHVYAVAAVTLRREQHRRRGEARQLERDLYAGPDRVIGGWGSDELH